MEYLAKQKREKLEAEAEQLFGNDILLKTAFVMSKMKASSEEICEVMNELKKEAEDLAIEMTAKMVYTYDASGNVVPIEDLIKVEEEIKISD